MITIFTGLFFIAHGLIFLFYLALARHQVQIEPPLTGFPEQAWLLRRFFSGAQIIHIATGGFALAALLFVAGGLFFLADAALWRAVLSGACLFSSALLLLLWDGVPRRLPEKGFVGIIINLVILGLLGWG